MAARDAELKSIITLFARQVLNCPHHIAVEDGNVVWTYRELDDRSSQYAQKISGAGLAKGALIAVDLPRGAELVAAVMGIWKYGATCLLLDPQMAPGRKESILAEARPAGYLHGKTTNQLCRDNEARLGVITVIGVSGAEDCGRAAGVGGTAPAYCLFTSGSTGKPKGVLVPHDGIANLIATQQRNFGLGPADRIAQFASPAFDAFIFELVMALGTGAALVTVDALSRHDGPALYRFLVEARVSVAVLPTILAGELALEAPVPRAALHTVLAAGEALPSHVRRRWRHPAQLWNGYGPTEATVCATMYCCTHESEDRIELLGKAVDGMQVYVLDEQGQAAAPGEVGEICIAGPGVALGYLNRPDLTAERFVPAAGDRPCRMYRTGDLGRWREDGNLEFHGRLDLQIKIRGFRIEPGEIEAVLRAQDGVVDAVVLPTGDEASMQRRLRAFVVSDRDDTAGLATGLRDALSRTLPDYMVPLHFDFMPALPTNLSGKVDRAALAAMPLQSMTSDLFAGDETSQRIAAIWSQLLGVEASGPDDSFYQLGGHSLLAGQMTNRINAAFGVRLGIHQILRSPTIAGIARLLADHGLAQDGAVPPVRATNHEGWLPASLSQAQVAFVSQSNGQTEAYVARARLALHGKLDISVLCTALQQIVERHEIFRTCYAMADGVLLQKVEPAWQVHLEVATYAGAEAERATLDAMALEVLDSGQLPLVSWRLLRVDPEHHVLLHVEHHYVHDGWSYRLFLQELAELYNSGLKGTTPALEAPVQFSAYSAWQHEWMGSNEAHAMRASWRELFRQPPSALYLPALAARAPGPSRAGVQRIALAPELVRALRLRAEAMHLTLFQSMFGVFSVLVSRLSGMNDFVLGTSVANRSTAEWEKVIGMVVNIVPVRVQLRVVSVDDGLRQARDALLRALEGAELPFSSIVEEVQPEREFAAHPLAQVFFSFHSALTSEVHFDGMDIELLEALSNEVPKFPLCVTGFPGPRDSCALVFEYDTAVYDSGMMTAFADAFIQALELTARTPASPVERLDTLFPWHHPLQSRWNETAMPVPGDCLHHLIEQQAARTPHTVALEAGSRRMTYDELNRAANRLAHHLRELDAGPDALVAVCLERGIDQVVALLAVLKAGAAYVPLDVGYPADRLAYMLSDSAPRVLLGMPAALAGAVLPPGTVVLEMGQGTAAWLDGPDGNPDVPGLTPEHLAYVIYTSGSTGMPKAVMVEHRSLVNHMAWMQQEFPLAQGDAVVQKTPFSFDASVWEYYAPLLAGGRLVLARPDGHRDPEYLAGLLRSSEAHTVQVVPTLLGMLLDTPSFADCRNLRRVFCGGEALSGALAERLHGLLPGVELVNLYGPTETTIDAAFFRCLPGKQVTLGRPVANTRIYVLDEERRQAAVGVAGEIYIAGAAVARGYLNQPDLTAAVFATDPFAPGRMYRTGDLGRWLSGGNIEFLGRRDGQVKIRGMRVELDEIEARLLDQGMLRAVAVAWHAGQDGGDGCLAAHCVPYADFDSAALCAHVALHLPEHMRPTVYVEVEALPLTPSGKVDRRALQLPAHAQAVPTPADEPESDALLQRLHGIMRELLPQSNPGKGRSFFEMGFFSLTLMRLTARCQSEFGVELRMVDVLQCRTAEALQALLRRRGAAGATAGAIPAAPRQHYEPLTYAQERLWFLAQLDGAREAYHVPLVLRLTGKLDHAALRQALRHIWKRHESLRTAFASVDGVTMQYVARVPDEFPLPVERSVPGLDAEASVAEWVQTQLRSPFDLERGPLTRVGLLALDADQHVLLFCMHHIIFDGWSMGVLLRELEVAYRACAAGEPVLLPPLPIQYSDYARWQRQAQTAAALQAQAKYWVATLADAQPLLELPADRMRPPQQNYLGALVTYTLSPDLTERLRKLSQRHHVPLSATMLSAWAALLSRLADRDDVVIGMPVANRARAETQGTVGLFANTVALRIGLTERMHVAALLQHVHRQMTDAQKNQDLPFEQVVELLRPARSLAFSPVFQVMFDWQQANESVLDLPGLQCAALPAAGHASAKFDLLLSLRLADDKIVCMVEYASALFDEATVMRYLELWSVLLESMVENEGGPVATLPWMNAGHLQQVSAWGNSGRPYEPVACVHRLFEAQARRTPEAIALVEGATSISYQELDALANQLARHLQNRGLAPGRAAGMLLKRSASLVIAQVAILKCGAIYVPLDPAWPEQRQSMVLVDSGARLVLTQSAASLPDGVDVTRIDLDHASWQCGERCAPTDGDIAVTAPAYLMYTSGSTGKPKGVLVPHRAIPRLVIDNGYAGFRPDDRWGVVSNPAFDASTLEVWAPLLTGGCAVIMESDTVLTPEQLARRLQRDGVTAMFMTTALFHYYAGCIGTALARLRLLIVGGDVLAPEAVVALRQGGMPGQLLNAYGPTENTTFSLMYDLRAGAPAGRPIPIGRPITGTRVYVLDRYGNPVPCGVAGEIHVAGAGVASGYWNRPDLTAEKFVADPFNPGSGETMYKTGDLGRWLADGNLEFLGRADLQVKIRGFRIEPGEVESLLTRHDNVREAVVAVREHEKLGKYLAAYYVADGGDPGADTLRRYLACHLPDFMVPSSYQPLDSLPLNANGKVDRKALPVAPLCVVEQAPPQGETEQAVARLWCEMLGVPEVGRDDDFFALGGHSLMVARLVSGLREHFGIDIVLADVFSAPRLRTLAERILELQLMQFDPEELATLLSGMNIRAE